MDKFKLLISFVQSQQTTLGLSLVTLLTAGGEQIFSTVVFKCPCNSWSWVYGLMFFIVPAILLFTLGWILNKTWRLCMVPCKWPPRQCCPTHLNQECRLIISVLVAPFSWIVVAFLNGVYFECTQTGVPLFREYICSGKTKACLEELSLFPCGKGSVPADERADVLLGIRAASQVFGWLLIAVVTVFGLLYSCGAKCCSKKSYLQLKFWQEYSNKESSLLEKHMAQNAECLAERNLKSFFQQLAPESVLTPSNEAWQKISSLFSFSTEQKYYSLLHQYVETQQGDNNAMSQSSDPRKPTPQHSISIEDEGKTMF